MMEIILAKNNGFCFGVKNAYDKSMTLSKGKIYFLGELVHNKETTDKLLSKGVIVQDINEVPNNSTVVIRAHGVSKEIYKIAQDKKIEVIDLTCPKVSKIHELINKYNDYFIVIIGKKNHPEILGSVSYANNYVVVEEESDIELISNKIKDYNDKIYIFSQTTFSKDKFNKITDKLKNIIENEIVIIPCICPTTKMRQEEIKELSNKVDFMLIIGGKNSSNTQKLYNIASNNVKSIWIENEKELNIDELRKYDKIGIASGASTDMETVIRIKEYIEYMIDNNMC